MKTTVDIPDALLREAKLAAAREGTTIRQILIDGLTRRLEPNRGKDFEFVTYGGPEAKSHRRLGVDAGADLQGLRRIVGT